MMPDERGKLQAPRKLQAPVSRTARNRIRRLERSRAGLVVIDIQEKLLPQIFEKERLVQNTVRLIKGATALKVPVFVTEQYRKGLGPTDSAVAAAMPEFAPMEKLVFSACGAQGFTPALRSRKVRDVLLCGMEAHVCVTQTCLDLLEENFSVFIVADAISSRTAENCRIAIARMHDAGAIIVSLEMVLFELLERSGTEEFRKVLELVR